jgi:hypothetical protein
MAISHNAGANTSGLALSADQFSLTLPNGASKPLTDERHNSNQVTVYAALKNMRGTATSNWSFT